MSTKLKHFDPKTELTFSIKIFVYFLSNKKSKAFLRSAKIDLNQFHEFLILIKVRKNGLILSEGIPTHSSKVLLVESLLLNSSKTRN